jgi:hypothetical protein
VHSHREVQELAALGRPFARAALFEQAVIGVFALDAHRHGEGAAEHRHPERAGGLRERVLAVPHAAGVGPEGNALEEDVQIRLVLVDELGLRLVVDQRRGIEVAQDADPARVETGGPEDHQPSAPFVAGGTA